MGDMRKYFDDIRDHKRRQKEQKVKELFDMLESLGVNDITALNKWQHHYRINGCYDVWVTTHKFKVVGRDKIYSGIGLLKRFLQGDNKE